VIPHALAAESERLAREYGQHIAVATDAALESGQIRQVRFVVDGVCLDVAVIVPDGRGGARIYHMKPEAFDPPTYTMPVPALDPEDEPWPLRWPSRHRF